ncbi:hypothetical protein Leryth_020626 [Lithospermum erythrorhizon]|nr:hypothetical protein Leryth_020626 [Lithospermum erythrorhizon]
MMEIMLSCMTRTLKQLQISLRLCGLLKKWRAKILKHKNSSQTTRTYLV